MSAWDDLQDSLTALEKAARVTGVLSEGDDAVPADTESKLATLEHAAERIEDAAKKVASLPAAAARRAAQLTQDAATKTKQLARDVEKGAEDLTDDAKQRLRSVRDKVTLAAKGTAMWLGGMSALNIALIAAAAYWYFFMREKPHPD